MDLRNLRKPKIQTTYFENDFQNQNRAATLRFWGAHISGAR